MTVATAIEVQGVETPHTPPPTQVAPEQTHASGVPTQDRQRVPLTMPRSQAYYWRSPWQKAERASLEEMAAGQAVRFDSDDPDDIIRWLDAPDESDPD
jgi:hypothetical protein